MDEIGIFGGEDARELIVGARSVMSDADVANLALLLPMSECRQSRAVILQIVNLHEIHTLRAQTLERLVHLANAGLSAAGPNFGGEEQMFAHAQFGNEIAHDAFRFAVHGRRVDDAAA